MQAVAYNNLHYEQISLNMQLDNYCRYVLYCKKQIGCFNQSNTLVAWLILLSEANVKNNQRGISFLFFLSILERGKKEETKTCLKVIALFKGLHFLQCSGVQALDRHYKSRPLSEHHLSNLCVRY